MPTYRNRVLSSRGVVFEPVDLYDGNNVIPDVEANELTVAGYSNGHDTPWPVVDGSLVPDAKIRPGALYWREYAPGRYDLRFLPSTPGCWSFTLTYNVVPQIFVFTYDVLTELTPEPVATLIPRFTP